VEEGFIVGFASFSYGWVYRAWICSKDYKRRSHERLYKEIPCAKACRRRRRRGV
jgi:hypothetical protein